MLTLNNAWILHYTNPKAHNIWMGLHWSNGLVECSLQGKGGYGGMGGYGEWAKPHVCGS